MSREQTIADSIAARVNNAPEEWKQMYLVLCKVLLQQQLYVRGEDLKTFCRMRGLWEPDTHNRWVGMPTVLEAAGWIEPLVKVKPARAHNHMPEVTFYRSALFDELTAWQIKP